MERRGIEKQKLKCQQNCDKLEFLLGSLPWSSCKKQNYWHSCSETSNWPFLAEGVFLVNCLEAKILCGGFRFSKQGYRDLKSDYDKPSTNPFKYLRGKNQHPKHMAAFYDCSTALLLLCAALLLMDLQFWSLPVWDEQTVRESGVCAEVPFSSKRTSLLTQS